MGLEALLSSFMKEDEKDTENYGVSRKSFFINSGWPLTCEIVTLSFLLAIGIYKTTNIESSRKSKR